MKNNNLNVTLVFILLLEGMNIKRYIPKNVEASMNPHQAKVTYKGK